MEPSGPPLPARFDPAPDPEKEAEPQAISVDAEHGSDSGDGTRARPLQTIAVAIARRGARTVIELCGGDYRESVTLVGGLTLRGGFDCTTWATRARASRIVSPTQPGVRAVGVGGITVADLDIVAPHATTPGLSSIGLTAVGSSIDLVRVGIRSGNGAAGRVGRSAAPATMHGPDGTAGGLVDLVCICPSGERTLGGGGGTLSVPPRPGAALPAFANFGGAGSAGVNGASAGEGVAGMRGIGGNDGAPALHPGALENGLFVVADGSDGKRGTCGQGGGGGGVAIFSAPQDVGGGGACGGCGGEGGGGGGGGGASIAVLADESILRITDSSLTAGDAGDGGDGTAGVVGSLGGRGGSRLGAQAARGGDGGDGGIGGVGGGGAGGSSIGVLHRGKPPEIDGVSRTRITTGRAGQGGGVGAQRGVSGLASMLVDARTL